MRRCCTSIAISSPCCCGQILCFLSKSVDRRKPQCKLFFTEKNRRVHQRTHANLCVSFGIFHLPWNRHVVQMSSRCRGFFPGLFPPTRDSSSDKIVLASQGPSSEMGIVRERKAESEEPETEVSAGRDEPATRPSTKVLCRRPEVSNACAIPKCYIRYKRSNPSLLCFFRTPPMIFKKPHSLILSNDFCCKYGKFGVHKLTSVEHLAPVSPSCTYTTHFAHNPCST